MANAGWPVQVTNGIKNMFNCCGTQCPQQQCCYQNNSGYSKILFNKSIIFYPESIGAATACNGKAHSKLKLLAAAL
jgi:hypothetical protein